MMAAPFPEPSASLPTATNRLPLGNTGLQVSPVCVGMTGSSAVITEAFDAGINFFFVSGDLHWPLYQGVRSGLQALFARGGGVRDEVVVAVVSYLDEPFFRYLQFNEVIRAVSGMERVDLMVAGGISTEHSFTTRLATLQAARERSHLGARAIGGSFHDRPIALASINQNALDVHFVRYNTAHTGANHDLFPHMNGNRTSPVFNFKSVLGRVSKERFRQMGGAAGEWLPSATDYYRFVLSNPGIDGVLCSPMSVAEVGELVEAMEDRPLSVEEQAYMSELSGEARMGAEG